MKRVASRITFFVSPHGFGHAARVAAIARELLTRAPHLAITIVTTVPEWFFTQSGVRADFHREATDVGFVQLTPTREDIAGTIRVLNDSLPFREERIASLAGHPCIRDSALIVCDIAPLGIAVAQRLGIPSVLVENFTWDWIYRGHADATPELLRYADYLEDIFSSATYRVQCMPVCAPLVQAVQVAPVSRPPRCTPHELRGALEIPLHHRIIVVSMGGITGTYDFFDRLSAIPEVTVIASWPGVDLVRRGSLILFPPRSQLYHPDLVTLSDAVVGKAGYSTVAEAYHAGCAFGLVERPQFREHPVLRDFLRANLSTVEFSEGEFESGSWIDRVPELLAAERVARPTPRPQGSQAIVSHLLSWCGS